MTVAVMIGAATVSTLAGFGFGILSVPVLLLLYPPQTAVMLTVVVSCGGTLVQWYRMRKLADYRVVGLLTVSSLFALPLGGYVLAVISPAALRLLISAVVLATVLARIRPAQRTAPAVARLGATAVVGAGAAAGILNATVGQPGLAVAMLISSADWSKETVRATLFATFMPINMLTVATLAWQGTLHWDLIRTGLLLIPAYVVGIIIAETSFRSMSQKTFQYLMLAVLAVGGVMGVVHGFSAIRQLF